MVAISQSIPGAVALICLYLLVLKLPIKGGIVAVLGCILPSFITILLIAMFFLISR